jgi:alanine dehydrogenase
MVKGLCMRIGVPREIKTHEYRVGLVPSSVRELTLRGHEVVIERDAARPIGLYDADYRAAGAMIADTAAEVFERAELIVKVKEPQPPEYALLRPGHTLFTYLHLAADRPQAEALLRSGATAIAYETVTDGRGRLPLLAPMSEVAGRMSIQAGAHCLEMEEGGAGVLLGGVAGVPPAEVVVLGAGIAGTNAARMAMGLGARVTVLDISLARLQELDMTLGTSLNTVYSTAHNIEDYVQQADLVIGAVLVPGAAAPRLVSEDLVRSMKHGAVIVDISIDQGGCIATSRPTNHAEPTFVAHGVVHYCVTNMPGAVARTSTFALNNATLPYVVKLAELGIAAATAGDSNLAAGVNIRAGRVVHAAVAAALDLA